MPHRYVKPIRRTSAPVHLVSMVAEPRPARPTRGGSVSWEVGRAVWGAYARREGSRWVGRGEPVRRSLKAWWDYVFAMLRGGRRLYVVTPSGIDTLTLAGFWRQLDNGRLRLCDTKHVHGTSGALVGKAPAGWHGRYVPGREKTIIDARSDFGTVTFTSVRNWVDATWEELGRAAGVSQPGQDGNPEATTCRTPDPFDQCTTLLRFLQRLMARWVTEGNGPWRETAGKLAETLWRTRYYTEKVCRHDDPDASNLEREALHGGRAESWVLSDVGWRLSLDSDSEPPPPASQYPAIRSQIHRLDVRSMYPALLRTERFPVRLLGVLYDVCPGRLPEFLKSWGAIARVTIRTDRPAYPVRTKDEYGKPRSDLTAAGIPEGFLATRDSFYPTGTFTTTLAGPELEHACRQGSLVRVYMLARYEMGRPLSAVADALLAERKRCRDAHDDCGELLAKTLANSLGGKFAQHADSWVARPGAPVWSRWGEWTCSALDRPTPSRWRAIAGLPFERIRGHPGRRLLAAVYCYLTSYGRMQMESCRSSLGADRVFAQDTDGIWVSDGGLSRAKSTGLLGRDTPGRMRLVSSHTYARWFGPKHYYCDGRWTLAGYSDGFDVLPNGRVVEEFTSNPITQAPKRAPRAVARVRRERAISSLPADGPVGADGWVRPWYVNASTPGLSRPRPGP